jgi:hypothetical protein
MHVHKRFECEQRVLAVVVPAQESRHVRRRELAVEPMLLPQPLRRQLAVRPLDEDGAAVGEVEEETPVAGEAAVDALMPERPRAEGALDDLVELGRG